MYESHLSNVYKDGHPSFLQDCHAEREVAAGRREGKWPEGGVRTDSTIVARQADSRLAFSVPQTTLARISVSRVPRARLALLIFAVVRRAHLVSISPHFGFLFCRSSAFAYSPSRRPAFASSGRPSVQNLTQLGSRFESSAPSSPSDLVLVSICLPQAALCHPGLPICRRLLPFLHLCPIPHQPLDLTLPTTTASLLDEIPLIDTTTDGSMKVRSRLVL